MKKLFTFLFTFLLFNSALSAQINLTSNGFTYSEDFAGLASTGTSSVMPTGFSFIETGTNANTTYGTGTGSGTSGETLSLGVAGVNAVSDRALGSLRSGSLISKYGAEIKNMSPSQTLLSISLSYDGECWRVGAASRATGDKLTFEYSTNATSLSTGTWTAVSSLDYTGPISTTIGAKDGNSTAFRTAGIAATISGLSVANGNSIWIRWSDEDATGSDDVLAIDNFQITASVLPVSLSDFSISKNNLSFTTASESNNSHFEIERSNDGKNYETISRIEGKGTTQEVSNYNFTDRTQNKGINYYRLKQVDFDGRFEYSKVVSVYVGEKNLDVNFASATNDVVRLNIFTQNEDDAVISIVDMNGRIILAQKVVLTAKDNQLNLDANLQNGMYVVKITTANGEQASKMLNIR